MKTFFLVSFLAVAGQSGCVLDMFAGQDHLRSLRRLGTCKCNAMQLLIWPASCFLRRARFCLGLHLDHLECSDGRCFVQAIRARWCCTGRPASAASMTSGSSSCVITMLGQYLQGPAVRCGQAQIPESAAYWCVCKWDALPAGADLQGSWHRACQ